jgi:hypothetical protein
MDLYSGGKVPKNRVDRVGILGKTSVNVKNRATNLYNTPGFPQRFPLLDLMRNCAQ